MNGEEQLSACVAAFPPKKQLAFVLLVFERMLPSLIAFSKDTGFDDSCYLRAKDAAWAALQNGAVDPALNQACLSGAPDTEEFSNELTSFALNAALAMSDILEFAWDARADHIVYILTLVRDSLHLYLGSLEPSIKSSPEKDARIASHSLMQQEQRREREDIEFLSELPDRFDEETISVLRARASARGSLLPPSV
jgi:hypothetical protein